MSFPFSFQGNSRPKQIAYGRRQSNKLPDYIAFISIRLFLPTVENENILSGLLNCIRCKRANYYLRLDSSSQTCRRVGQ